MIAMQALSKLNKDNMSATEIARLMEVGSKLERLARDLPTDNGKGTLEITGDNPLAEFGRKYQEFKRQQLEQEDQE